MIKKPGMERLKNTNEMPIASETVTGNATKKYYTADEAMTFLEPRIRALFK